MVLQLLSNTHVSVMFVKIIGIKSKYLIVFKPTPVRGIRESPLLPTPYSQGDVARMHEKWYHIK